MTYSTVTLFARFLGWSTSQPLARAIKYENNCNAIVANITNTYWFVFGTKIKLSAKSLKILS